MTSILGFAGLPALNAAAWQWQAHGRRSARAGDGRLLQSGRPADTVALQTRVEGGRRRWTVAVG